MADAIRIKMTPADMRVRATSFTAEGSNMATAIRNMDGLLTVLESEWEGKAANAFCAQYKRLRPSFVKMKYLIDNIAKQLDGTADALEKLDQEIASKFGVSK